MEEKQVSSATFSDFVCVCVCCFHFLLAAPSWVWSSASIVVVSYTTAAPAPTITQKRYAAQTVAPANGTFVPE